ncbi:hypothetical protein [Citrobacter braakii]|uniref:hypothetical protein n=1 Tax=Citrobacter braakii TaxID=57706 RepID=UPI000CEF0DD4|nr:hypothetical protein [Citrobacter braakii]PPS50650.1 hypothetical protein BWR12_13120 [Citrobacter braakii]
MTLFTLPKWAALAVAILIWPALSLAMSAWLFIESGNSFMGFASGVFASCVIGDVRKIRRAFFNG